MNKLKAKMGEIIKTWGPAWLVMIADVDAASAITAADSGAQYGTKLVWFIMLLVIPLYVIQEIAGRVGVVTGKGFGELIRENYRKRVAVLCAVPMALVDIISYIVEYTGIAVGFQMMGISPWISVPISFLAHVIVVYNKKYAEAEKPLLIISIIFSIVWIVAAFLTARNGIEVTPFYFSKSPDFIFLLAANIGAVIMPFMLFYQVSATAEKGTDKSNIWAVRFETLIGALFSELIMVAIAVSAIGISANNLDFTSPKVLSQSLTSVAGYFAPYVFGIGLITASFIALIVISLGSCWGVTEAMGWGKKHWFKVYLIESIPAVIIPLFSFNLIKLALNLMVLQIVVLIAPAIILGIIASNKKLMGEFYLRGFNKLIYWVIIVLIFVTGIVSMLPTFGIKLGAG
ncbi:MAG: divalent metal cation transporter [Candidatus Omnitrophica bacterium]|nr:divalent metal cation transporter [Candidatus Omnitrophota bacterium]